MAFQDEFLNIDTPENVIFGYEVVGIGSRFMAALIDTTIILISQIVVYLTMALLVNNLLDMDIFSTWVLAIFGLIAFALLWGYYIFFEILWNGQSPGKRLVNLRVLKADGTPITLTESVIRNLIRLIDFLPLFYGLGVIVMFINGQSRRLGDLAAGTLVVRDQASLDLENLTAAPRPYLPQHIPVHIAEQVGSWPVARLSDEDIQLAEEFLIRHKDLENSSQLAQQILQRLLTHMELPDWQVDRQDYNYLLAQIVKASRHDD